jgi:pyrroline-5-carboxylate reductase
MIETKRGHSSAIPEPRMKTVFIGGGRITSALLAGLRLAGYRQPLIVHDRNAHKLRALKREFKVATEPDFARAVEQADLLIIAVRPQDVMEVLARICTAAAALPEMQLKAKRRSHGKTYPIACSLAAGIPLAKLCGALPKPYSWTRAMPSPAARFGRGLTAVAFEKSFPKPARNIVARFFAHVGPVLEIAESQYDAFTVTYSTSHGYHALATLAKAAEKAGLDHRIALSAAAHALADGVLAWREGNLSLEKLLEEAATPGGIAATVMNNMDAQGYSQIVERSLRAGIARARQNAKR